jgi:hypothetical protein
MWLILDGSRWSPVSPNRYSTNALGQHKKGLQCGEDSRLPPPDQLIELETSLLGNHDVRIDQWEIAPNGARPNGGFLPTAFGGSQAAPGR